MKYDVFISYRREGGYDTAKHLYDLLSRDGYRVSFDIDTLRNGDFDTSLYKRIDECEDFIIVIDSHAFDRTLDSETPASHDWLRLELAYALQKEKNIIPVFLRGISGFPPNLPPDIIEVTKKNGPEYSRYHFNNFYKILRNRFLHKSYRKKLLQRLSLIGVGLCIILATILICWLYKTNSDSNSSYESSDLTNSEALKEDPIQNHNEHYGAYKNNLRDEILSLYTGSFLIEMPGAMKDGITHVYEMELDPINKNIVVEDFNGDTFNSNSIGWCGTAMQMPEIWEIYEFSLRNDLSYALAKMKRIDEFYEGENKICTVKLQLDDFNNIKMSLLEGNDGPGVLYDGYGGLTGTATFNRN